MKIALRVLSLLSAALLFCALLGAAGLGIGYLILAPKLPSAEVLRDVRLQVPLRVYTRDGALMAEFGEKKRSPLRYEQFPQRLVQAFVAAEDDRFFEHPGVDYQGLIRAIWNLVRTGERAQGGSTITMQVARNFFLSSEKTYLRKANEIILALKIERELSKEQILELYLNKIYLGNRAYGVAAAAQVYYGRPLEELTLAELAMIAGLPKAPSAYNPLVNPERALQRRAYVLRRMHELGFISREEMAQAAAAPNTARYYAAPVEVDAPYVAEMVRAEMVARFGADEAYTAGYRVFTTVGARLQRAAADALRGGLLAYDERHGYRGPAGRVDLQRIATEPERRAALAEYASVAGLRPALVEAVDAERARLLVAGEEQPQTVGLSAVEWAGRFVSRDVRGELPTRVDQVLSAGDVVYLRRTERGWRLAEIPEVEGALVALRPGDGALLALVGGFDFYRSKFNRATQAQRQPGSAFKPFIYSAALTKGFTPATVVNDAPVVFQDAALEEVWRPENASGRFYGPTRLREALAYSRNLVSIRVLQSIGVSYALAHAKRFGFAPERLAPNLSLSLGNASVTPLELATAYAVFANGGFRVEPYFIDRIEDADGKVVFQAQPAVACPECALDGPIQVAASPERVAERVITAQNAYLMESMMRDVTRYGTARRAAALKRSDLAGKTGSTNDHYDAWFAGFNSGLVAAVWVGFDQLKSLGVREGGAQAALPIWLDFAKAALEGVPERERPIPERLVTLYIDPETGLRARPENEAAIPELFEVGTEPPFEPSGRVDTLLQGPGGSLF